MPVNRSQLQRMIARMEEALSIMEKQQEARQDALDREFEEDCRDEEEQFINPLDAPPNPPFSDGIHGGPPAHIHDQPRRDLFK